MVNRPEHLAEGAGADGLLLVIWKEGSKTNNTNTYSTRIKKIIKRHSLVDELL